jgi:hypothetical protein
MMAGDELMGGEGNYSLQTRAARLIATIRTSLTNNAETRA